MNTLRDTDQGCEQRKHERTAELEIKTLAGWQDDKTNMQKHRGSKKTTLDMAVTSLTIISHFFIGLLWFISARTLLTQAAAVTEKRRRRWRVNKRHTVYAGSRSLFPSHSSSSNRMESVRVCVCVRKRFVWQLCCALCYEWPWHGHEQGTVKYRGARGGTHCVPACYVKHANHTCPVNPWL